MADIIIVAIFIAAILFTKRRKQLPEASAPVNTSGERKVSGTPKFPDSKKNVKHTDTDYAPKYIVHTELEDGYMNLNGKRVRIKDADKLEW
ncbi:MAG: hypothetical protein KA965_06665 [Butyrivibrio sp.]|nr:hypothetical protein [Butyrivibrio sp.]